MLSNSCFNQIWLEKCCFGIYFNQINRLSSKKINLFESSFPFISWSVLIQLMAQVQPPGDSFPCPHPCKFSAERWSSGWKAPSRRYGCHVRSCELSPACPWLGKSQWLHCHLLNETSDKEMKKQFYQSGIGNTDFRPSSNLEMLVLEVHNMLILYGEAIC